MSVVRADFNGDGKTDLAVVNECGTDPNCPPFVSVATVSILLGNGDGTFLTKSNLITGGHPISAAVGDFNHDGNVDLAVISDPNCQGCAKITIFLGHGDGTFTDGYNPLPGIDGFFLGIVAGDFNGDGKLDLAVSGEQSNPFVLILLGNGDGTFSSSYAITPPEIAQAPTSLATGDFNNDGILDLACVDLNSDPNFRIFLGNGDGTFTPATLKAPQGLLQSSPPFPPPQSMATGDFDGNGTLDLAFVDSHSSLLVLSGNGDGTFVQQSSQPVSAGPAFVSTGDFNGDGTLDLAVVYSGQMLSIYMGNGDGTFQTGINPNAGNAPSGGLGIGDFNGDGRMDVAVSNSENNTISVLTQTAGVVVIDIKPGSDTNPINPASHGKIPVAILTTDLFDATTVDAATVRFGATGTEAAPVRVEVEDVNGDGRPDLLFHFNTQDTSIRCGETSASLTGKVTNGQAIAAADFIRTVGCRERLQPR